MSKRILIIEDEQVLADLLVKKLEEEGYTVELARDGAQGMDKLREADEASLPNLLLLDMMLPGMPGIEILEEMNTRGLIERVPVVIISNSGQPVEIDRARELGVRDWLVKTEFDPLEVIEKVRGQIG